MFITIIGAGPIGCYCGYLLAKAGHKVEIYEEHPEIGLPIQCTGLLTSDFDQFNLNKESFLINTFEEIEVNSPKHKVIIPQKEYLINRYKFDNYLADLARKAGAKIYLNHSFLRKEGKSIIIKDNTINISKKEIILTPDKIIAADGPLSKTAKAFDLFHKNRINYQGIQAIVKGKFDPKRYHTYFGRELCPDLFGWIVPESKNRARVGLASTKNAKLLFDHFLRKFNFKILEIQSGMIPLYSPKQKLQKDNCYLLGDASGFVKATTLGGIIPEMQQAQILVNCIINCKNYEPEVKPLKKKLNLHLKLRNIFNKFSDKDWNKLVYLISQDKIEKILIENTRENPKKLVIKTLWKEPRLLYFVRYLF